MKIPVDRKTIVFLPLALLFLIVPATVWSFGSINMGYGFYLWFFVLIFLLLFTYLSFEKKIVTKDLGLKTNGKKVHDYFVSRISLPESRIKLYRKCLAFFMILIFMTRFYMNHDYLENVVGLQSDFMTPFQVGIGALLSNYWIGALIFVLISQFFDSRSFHNIVRFVAFPVLLLCLFFFPYIAGGINGESSAFVPRVLLMAIELGMGFAFSLDTWKNNLSFKIDKKEIYTLVIGLILLVLCTIGDYLPANLFGLKMFSLDVPLDFNLSHRLFIYAAFLLPILYYSLLYRFDSKNRRAFLFFIAFAVFFSYAAIRRYDSFTSVVSLPLHLCNTAMYIMPFTLVFLNYGLFYFTMFVNVIGAFLAMLMPNYSSSLLILSPSIIEFFNNHLYAFFMPVLIILLGVYERPKMKYFFYSMIGFLAYFILVTVLNMFYDTDFFFLNSNFIVKKLGDWAVNIFHDEITFDAFGKTLTVRPLYLVLFYLIYVGFSFVIWYVYEMLFKATDQISLIKSKTMTYETQHEEYIKNIGKDKIMKPLNMDEIVSSLEVSHLYKKYPGSDNDALVDMTFKLERGHIYGFLGKNGAGKSTTLKAIVGIHPFERGSINVCGFDVVNEPQKAKMTIGYVPDNYALYENLTGRQYIEYMATIYKVGKKEMETRSRKLVKALEMEKNYDLPMRDYSHGMKQKITIIGALIHEPKVWILDEPMTGLDPNSIFQIKETMHEYAKKGNIVFFSSHIIDVVNNLCDKVIIIKNGRLLEEDDVDDLKKKGIDLERHFLTLTADNKEEARKLIAEEKKYS